jgi:uncharacterized membrane protein (DUF4010 family)
MRADRRPLRLREALAVAALLLAVATTVAWARSRFGSEGLWIGTALAAVADAHAPIATGLAMHHAGTIPANDALRAVLLAIGVNTVSRTVVATLAGGARYGLRVASVLAASVAAAVLALAWWPALGTLAP